MQRIGADNNKAQQNETHKAHSNPLFSAMVFGGGLAVVAFLALPLAVPAIAVGVGAVGLGAVASSTAIGLGFVTTGAVAGGALGYNYGSDVIKFIETNTSHREKVVESFTQSERVSVGGDSKIASGDGTGITPPHQDSMRQSARSESPTSAEVVNRDTREVGAAPSDNNMGGEQQAHESIPATPQQKEETLAFLKKFMEFRIQEVDKILKEKSDKGSKKSSIESFLNDVDKSFNLDIAKDKLYIPEDDKDKVKKLFEQKAPTCFDIVRGDRERYKENTAKLREHKKEVKVEEKIIMELSKIITHKFKIISLLSAGKDKAVVDKAVDDKAVVDKVKNFSKEFKSYWNNAGGKQTGSDIEKDVEAIKKIFKESVQKGGYQNEAHIYFETSAEPKKETPSATPRASRCFGFVFGSKIVGSDQLKIEELRSSPMKNNERQTEKSHGAQGRDL